MIGIKMNSFDTTVGEPDQDANSALTELDKGLRSGKVGEQCEAIVRFPRLFEKYPFPILINSSFLKLADVFRMGNNFLRLWVLRVCQQSENHLDKILNVDEFLRRVFSVLHSNDPLARALALRTLGAVAGIIPERQNVHHAIRRGLDSHDNVEVDAAIYATTRFAAHSNTFAVAMCNKLSDMVECENTGADRRDKLVKALRTVHGGAVRAEGVLKLLHSLMERYPSSSFVRASITALTAIAADTVVHVPDQVGVLISIAVNDPRSAVRCAALVGLKQLAAHAALWPAEAIRSLVVAATARHGTQHTMLCLNVMQSLVKCPAVCAAAGSVQSYEGVMEPHSLIKFCQDAALSVELTVASTAARVLTDIVVHCCKEFMPVEGGDLMLALESLVVATGTSDCRDLKPLRVALRCLVQLSTAEPSIYATRTSMLLGAQLRSIKWAVPDGTTDPTKPVRDETKPNRTRLESILEALCALGGGTYCPQSVKPAMPAVIEKLKEASEAMNCSMETDSSEPTTNGTALVLLCTVIFQERAGTMLSCSISDEWQHSVLAAISAADGWTQYRIARAALRYGHTSLAAKVFKELAALAPSESAQRWLSALHIASKADCQLVADGIPGLEEASASWELAGEAAAAGSPGGMLSSWMCARATALSALARTAAAVRSLCTQPPPAVAHTHAQASREPTAKSGACALALRKAARALQAASQKYADIGRNAFHADDSTLRHLQYCQYTYNLLSQFLDSISSSTYREKQTTGLELNVEAPPPETLEEKMLAQVTSEIQRIFAATRDRGDKIITHQHAKAVLLAVSACCGHSGWTLLAWAGSGAALCRLSVAPRGPEPAAALPLQHHLAVHIEGLVRTPPPLKKNQVERQVKGVQLTVTVTPHPRTNEKTVDLTNVPPIMTAVQTVTPVRSFFSGQQLVSVPTAGVYTVGVQAACIDQNGTYWQNNQNTTLLVKAHDGAATKSNVPAQMAPKRNVDKVYSMMSDNF